MPTETLASFGVRPNVSFSVLVEETTLTVSFLVSSLVSFDPLPPLAPTEAG